MDEVVAVEVELASGEKRYFLTWGRIQAAVDPEPLAALVLVHSRSFSINGEAVAARVCLTLRVAADSGAAPYFYECLLQFAARAPYGDGYERWRADRADAMAHGREIAYCGAPGHE